MNDHSTSSNDGFSAVELIITIMVAGLFIVALYQLFGTISVSMSQARQKAIASELAYSYLRRYTGSDSSPSSWFTCSTASGGANTNDYTINTSAPGQTLTSGTLSSVEGLANPVSYSVTALAIYGCSSSNTATPLRIEATVTYGPRAQTVRHVTLQGY